MSFIVGASFCCMVVSGAVGLEWASVSNIGFALAALAATVFFSAIDAWEGESDRQEVPEAPISVKATQ
jgi:hypothetical protein